MFLIDAVFECSNVILTPFVTPTHTHASKLERRPLQGLSQLVLTMYMRTMTCTACSSWSVTPAYLDSNYTCCVLWIHIINRCHPQISSLHQINHQCSLDTEVGKEILKSSRLLGMSLSLYSQHSLLISKVNIYLVVDLGGSCPPPHPLILPPVLQWLAHTLMSPTHNTHHVVIGCSNESYPRM